MEPVTLCVLLWARPGKAEQLLTYEESVLELMSAHGAAVIWRVVNTDAEPTQPLEVQLLRYPSQSAFAAFLSDPRRRDLAVVREDVVAATSLFPVEVLDSQPAPVTSERSAAELGDPGGA